MAYDYAKSATNKWSQKKRGIAQNKGRVITLMILAIAFVFYRYSSIDFNKIKKGVSKTIVINQARPKQLPKPKFEFYTRLPKGDIAQQHEPMHYDTEKKSLENKTYAEQNPTLTIQSQGQHYLIQVGAFKQFSDADKLRAELIMQGHSANLSEYKNATTIWYRVEIGPFSSLTLAKNQQQALEHAHYNGLIKKIG